MEAYVSAHRERMLGDLMSFIRIPSATGSQQGIRTAAAFLSDRMVEAGFKVRVLPTGGNPVVFGVAGPEAAPLTLLVYGHYDVFPARREDGWHTDPFDPVLAHDRIYGRGAGDNKGQVMAYIEGVRAYRALRGELPIHIKLLVEGEEEVGSPHLPEVVSAHRADLQADACIYSDGSMLPGDSPCLVYGARGSLCLEFEVPGSPRPLHSGHHGGVARNPAIELCGLLAKLTAAIDRSELPGLPEVSVRTEDLDAIALLPFDYAAVCQTMGGPPITGPSAIRYYERLMLRPSVNVSGLGAGYVGDGFRTTVPARAVAKMDIRLVGSQDPEEVLGGIQAFLRAQGFDRVAVRKLAAQPPSRTPISTPFSAAVQKAVARGFGQEPLIVPSLPATTPDWVFTQILRLPSIGVPLAPHDQQNHGPNESTRVSLFLAGVMTAVHLVDALAHGTAA